jgi:hypothetical protein
MAQIRGAVMTDTLHRLAGNHGATYYLISVHLLRIGPRKRTEIPGPRGVGKPRRSTLRVHEGVIKGGGEQTPRLTLREAGVLERLARGGRRGAGHVEHGQREDGGAFRINHQYRRGMVGPGVVGRLCGRLVVVGRLVLVLVCMACSSAAVGNRSGAKQRGR